MNTSKSESVSMLILKLDIDKTKSEVHCEYRETSTSHNSIAAALLYYGEDIAPDLARFVEICYLQVSLGTTPVTTLATASM